MRFLSCFLILLAGKAMSQFSPKENQMITDALGIGNYTVEDLQFARQSASPRFGLEMCGRALTAPIAGGDMLMSLHSKADLSTQKMLAAILSDCFKDSLQPSNKVVIGAQLKGGLSLPSELREPVTDLVEAIAVSNTQIREAVGKLTAEEKRIVIESLPQWASVGTDLQFEFVSKPKMTQENLYAALSKVNLQAIRQSALELDRVVQDSLPKLRLAAASGWIGKVLFAENGVAIEVCGVGDDLHDSKNSNLCIDLGGRNRYLGRYGAGIGYASVLVDLGNEINTNFPDASTGIGILGVGIAVFEGARPDLNGKNIAFGAGLAGVGIMKVDQAFRMESRSLGQGFGMCGIGLLISSKGTDSQKIGYLGQGAGIMGGVGWLYNPAGNDRYRAGGLIPDGISQKGFLSRSQGYSGIMPGGIGLLTDNAGDDLYESGSESQACANGYGIGSLYDLSGEDAYVGQRQAQAYASSEGVAMLFDLAGDDTYMVRENECQAYAVDRSVAMVLDRSGDDVVAAHDSQPATAQDGSVAIYLDAEGSDSFSGPVGVGVQMNGRFGVGLFVDFGGDNHIANGPSPGTGVFRDSSIAFNGEEGPLSADISPFKPGSITANSDEIDTLWENVIAGGKDTTNASRRLNGIGLPAFIRFCDNFAHQSNPRAKRVAANILALVPDAKKVLGERAAVASAYGKRTLFELAAQTKSQELKLLIGPALENEVTRRMATRYASAIGAKEFIDPISGLVLSGDALTAQDAVIALVNLSDEKMVSTMESLVQSPDVIIREQAIRFIGKYPRGITLAKQLLARTDEKSQVVGIELLGVVGTDEALRLAGSGLNSVHKGAKIKAMTTLSGRVPEAYRARIIELTKDLNPMVAAVAKGVDLGR